MPTVRMLRTTLGGYDVFNLTSAIIDQYQKVMDVTSQVDVPPGNTLFTIVPFVGGTLEVFKAGLNETGVAGYITENPGAGTFSLSSPPDPVSDIPLIVRFTAA